MKLFSYINNKEGYYKDGKFVEPFFIYAAETIGQADAKLWEELGINAQKSPWIGVKIEKIP